MWVKKKKRNVEFRFPHQTCLRSPRFYLNWSWQQHLVLESFRWSLPHSSVQPCGFFLWFPLIHPLLPIFQFLSQGPPISPSPWLACWWPARVSVRWIIPPTHTPPLKPSAALTPLINSSKCLCLAFGAFHVLTPMSMLCSRLSEQLGVPRTWNPQASLKCSSPWPGWHSFKGLPHSSSLNACFFSLSQ